MQVNIGITLSEYGMYITKHNLQYYFLIASAKLSCSHFPFLCRKGGWGNIFPRVHQLEGVFAVRTNVSMGDLVVAIPLFSCCFFPTSSFFYMCTHITTRQSLSFMCFQLLHIGGVIDVWSSYNDQQGSLYIVVVTASLSIIVSCYVSMHFELELSHGMIPEFL